MSDENIVYVVGYYDHGHEHVVTMSYSEEEAFKIANHVWSEFGNSFVDRGERRWISSNLARFAEAVM